MNLINVIKICKLNTEFTSVVFSVASALIYYPKDSIFFYPPHFYIKPIFKILNLMK